MVSIPTAFQHGVRGIRDTDGIRPVRVVPTHVVGLVGTAPEADAAKFPVNTPVAVIADETLSAALGATGTLPNAMDGIYDQVLTTVVVVRVDDGADAAETETNVIGGTEADGSRTGLWALLSARAVTGLHPRILIAPGFSHQTAVLTEMEIVAGRLRGWVIPDAPDTTIAASIAYRGGFSSSRLYGPIFPWVVRKDRNGADATVPASAVAAGLLVKRHFERNIAWSPSNQVMAGIIGTSKPIDFVNGLPACEANTLNAANVNTVIRDGGYRLWGNHTCSDDENYRFLPTQIVEDTLLDSIIEAYRRAVDRPYTRSFFDDLVDTGNAFMRDMANAGVILGGRFWADPELNSNTQLLQGRSFINFQFLAPTPAEDINVISRIEPSYFRTIFEGAA